MKITPFREHRDSLFTDFTLQIFNAHISENSEETLSQLMKSYESEAEGNPAFMPGVVFGAIVHMFMMMQILSEEKGIETQEMVKEYTEHYNSNRTKLSRMLGNRPEYAKKLANKFYRHK